jgi:metal-responsive CopG/Arc/MetJ family transcriptional regulator
VWFQYATETTIAVDGILDEVFEPYQYDERQELIEAAVRREVDRRKQEIENGG